jgi:NAD(P)-dependent dehydrogenase (short-subunit alcohol dehydrogenase family)
MNLQDSVALVTGANRGLGRAFAQGLRAAGARKVYAAARDLSSIDLPGVVPIALDVTDDSAVRAAARDCGDVTLLVNNAGIARRSPFLGDGAADALREMLDTNFFGMLATSRAFAPILQANGGGALVNMLSVLSWINMPVMSGYGASKAAAWALTNGLRNELRSQGTLVVGVHAAFIDTDMARNVPAPKTRPEDVVRQVLDALEAGQEEVFADAITRAVKSGLSAQPAVYLREA